MGEDLVFTFSSADLDGQVSFSGQLVLTPTAVPEPTSLMLLGLGLVGLMALRRGMRNTPKSGR